MIRRALGAAGFAVVIAGCHRPTASRPAAAIVQRPEPAAPVEDRAAWQRDRDADQARIRDADQARIGFPPSWQGGEVDAGPVASALFRAQEDGDPVASMPPDRLGSEAVAVSRQLAAMAYFAVGGIGYAGAPSTGETTARALAVLPTAVDSAEWLVAHGGPAGRLYGFWILRHRAPHRARRALTRLRHDRSLVVEAHGCLAEMSSVGIVARRLDLDAATAPRP